MARVWLVVAFESTSGRSGRLDRFRQVSFTSYLIIYVKVCRKSCSERKNLTGFQDECSLCLYRQMLMHPMRAYMCKKVPFHPLHLSCSSHTRIQSYIVPCLVMESGSTAYKMQRLIRECCISYPSMHILMLQSIWKLAVFWTARSILAYSAIRSLVRCVDCRQSAPTNFSIEQGHHMFWKIGLLHSIASASQNVLDDNEIEWCIKSM